MNQTIVWGGTGFLGRHLIAGLLRAGQRVTLLTRRPARQFTYAGDCRVKPVCVPEGREGLRVLACHLESAQTVFNLAGVSGAVVSNRDFISSLDGNCRIQAEFLEACAIAGSRPHVVFASSRLVYGKPDVLPVNEDAPLRPTSAYAAHKLCVEHYHQISAVRGSISYTICRISNPYGKVEDDAVQRGYGFISNLIRRGVEGKTLNLFGDGTQLRDYIHVSDLTAALLLAATHPAARNEVLNIGSGRGTSIRDAATAVQNLTGASVAFAPWPDEYLSVESGDYVADISKARQAIGFKPKFRFEDGLKHIVEQYHQEVKAAVDNAGVQRGALSA
jgi:UDP-glucose 4-epimerase